MVERVRISVAMITYNGVSYLKEQLCSILDQLTPADEVVISDDGSRDGTLSLIETLQKSYPHISIRLLKGPGQGIKANMAHALSACNGEYLFLADQDDIWFPDKVEKVLQAFAETQTTLVIHDAVVFSKDPSSPDMPSFFAFRSAGAGVWKNLYKNSYIGCCMAFRRRLLRYILPIPNQIEMHDQWIGILNDHYYRNTCFLRTPLLYYRRHEKNSSSLQHHHNRKRLTNRLTFLFHYLKRTLR